MGQSLDSFGKSYGTHRGPAIQLNLSIAKLRDDMWAALKAIHKAPGAQEVLDLVLDQIIQFKYRGCLFAELPLPGQLLEDVTLGVHWPDEYLKIYREGRYEQDDPLFHRCRQALLPFVWTEHSTENETSARGHEFLKMAVEHGFRRGFAVPIHGPKGYAACVRLGGMEPDTSRKTRIYLRILAVQAFEKLLSLKHSRLVRTPLTQREQEVLQLVALGKSGQEVGTILSITKRTADEHVRNACAKLGASNRTHAVAIAISEDLVSLA